MEDTKIEAESIIKTEEIKPEVDDHGGEDDCYFTEGGGPSFSMREVKEEDKEVNVFNSSSGIFSFLQNSLDVEV